MALVVTLAVVAVLLAAGFWLTKYTGDAVMATLAEKDRFQAEQLALSGIEIAKLILIEDAAGSDSDSVQETWADPKELAQAVAAMGIRNDELTIRIIDEYSKIQINALIKQFPGNEANPDQMNLWERFLGNREKKDMEEKINSLKDWLDSGDDDAITGLSGAESDYYKRLTPPYECANSPLSHVEELLSIKGFPMAFLDEEGSKEGQAMKKLDDIFTVYGFENDGGASGSIRYPGLININTAGVDILSTLLPEGMEMLAKELVDFREAKGQKKTEFLNPLDQGWYKKAVTLPDKDQIRIDHMVRYSSNTFKIESLAQKNASRVSYHAFLIREKNALSGKWTCRILQMERK